MNQSLLALFGIAIAVLFVTVGMTQLRGVERELDIQEIEAGSKKIESEKVQRVLSTLSSRLSTARSPTSQLMAVLGPRPSLLKASRTYHILPSRGNPPRSTRPIGGPRAQPPGPTGYRHGTPVVWPLY